jgi:hypothetical protein
MPTTRVILPPLGIFGLWLASRARHAYPPVRVLTSRAYRLVRLAYQLISQQPAVLFSQNKSAISNQPTVFFSQNKPAPATSQPNMLNFATFLRHLPPLNRRRTGSCV